jgi:DNA-binding protein
MEPRHVVPGSRRIGILIGSGEKVEKATPSASKVQPRSSNSISSVSALMERANLVRVGKKPIMNYVVACVTLFNSGADEVMVRARGQAITKAVDTVLMLRNSFLKDLEIEDIAIGSEEVTRQDGSRGTISTIEILLGK